MADKRITELNLTTDPQASDLLPIVNSGETKKVTYGTLRDKIHESYDTGSLMITGSLSGTTLTFEKGDTSTFDIDLSNNFVTPAQTGSFLQPAYLSCFSSASQALAVSGSAQAATFTSVWLSEGVTLTNNSRINFEKAGIYNLTFTAQIANAANTIHDAWFWVQYMGQPFPFSSKRMTLQARKNNDTPSGQTMTINIVGQALNDNDYIDLYWTGDSIETSIRATPANNNRPASPSIIASIVRVG